MGREKIVKTIQVDLRAIAESVEIALEVNFGWGTGQEPITSDLRERLVQDVISRVLEHPSRRQVL